MSRRHFNVAALSLLCAPLEVGARAELKAHTLRAFQRYAQLTEKRVLDQATRGGPFLYLDHLPTADKREVLADLRGGELVMEKLETKERDGREVKIDDGLIHHWLGAVFAPRVGLAETVALVQDYENHDELYAPEVVESRVLWRDGDRFRVFMRFRKKKVITVVTDTVHEVEYVSPATDRTYAISRTSSVREVEDAGSDDEQILADGQGPGFLWRLNSYWRFLERDGGTYIECESISLTRTIPFLVRWLVAPFVNGVPREQLEALLSTTRTALLDHQRTVR